jgi:L-alanine-DL-glutamate epimerase-like enolase superfamily enzyme
VKITDIKSYTIELEPSQGEDYRYHQLGITEVFTDEGITGYGFRKVEKALLDNQVRPALIGKDPRNIIGLLASGALKGCATVENALWDISGKAAGVPIRTLLGAANETIPYYLTCVWPGKTDQSHLTIDFQAEQIAHYYSLGHTRFKFRGWRQNPLDDVKIVEKVRNLVGGRDKIELMIDRTAHLPGWIWTYEQARDVALALQELDATWLEEPFAREDLDSYRRLADEVDIPITGGEFSTDLSIFKDYVSTHAVDIIQPDVSIAGGIWRTRLVAALAEFYEIPCILHGTNGPDLAASLQVASTIPTCRMMEVALIFPPLTPQEMYAPLQRILKSDGLYNFKNGDVILSKAPGLGVEIDALELAKCKVVD